MRIGLQNTDWGYIGAKLAQVDDNEQAEFFRAFVEEIKTFETQHQRDVQLSAIGSKLSNEEKKYLSVISYIDEGE